MICLNMDGRNFESDAGIIREQEVRIMQNGKTKGILCMASSQRKK